MFAETATHGWLSTELAVLHGRIGTRVMFLKETAPQTGQVLALEGWHLRAPLKLGHLGRLYFPLDILPSSSYQGNSLESVYVAVVGLG